MKTKWFDYSFLTVGLLVQIVTFVVANEFAAPDSQLPAISLISGLLGVCSVCLCAQGNIGTYVFGFAQVITYTYLCYQQRFYGEIAINAYYFVTMIYGVIAWKKRLQATENGTQVTPRTLSVRAILLIALSTVLLSTLVGWGLATWTDDTQPYLDAYTTVPALVAQVLMILAYREHWFIWLAVDIFSVVLWLRAGDYCMTAQYVFWCANCLYGLRRWKTLTTNR